MPKPTRYRPLVLLTAILLAAFFFLAYPIYVIRPFRYQGPRELAAALIIMQYRPGVEILCAVPALLILMTARRRAAAYILTILIFACGLLSRVNIYEKMFHPLDRPTFSAAGQAKLDAAEQVIAVVVNKSARAYPIRDISYHHIVNDTLGGRAIVATY